jgi:ATP-dependent phosphoenolpyruvate carboxykinase
LAEKLLDKMAVSLIMRKSLNCFRENTNMKIQLRNLEEHNTLLGLKFYSRKLKKNAFKKLQYYLHMNEIQDNFSSIVTLFRKKIILEKWKRFMLRNVQQRHL